MATMLVTKRRNILFVCLFTFALLAILRHSRQLRSESYIVHGLSNGTGALANLVSSDQGAGSHGPRIVVQRNASEGMVEQPLQGLSVEQMKRQLEEVRLSLKLSKNSSTNDWFNCSTAGHSYWFPNIKTIFTGIPKSGCSNWIEVLMRAEGILERELHATQLHQIHSQSIFNKQRMNQIAKSGAFTISDLEGALRFVVLRNPWTRLVSGWRDKLSDEDRPGLSIPSLRKAIVSEIRPGAEAKTSLENEYPTLAETLAYIVKKEGNVNVHFKPQYRTMCLKVADYDYLLPLEYSSGDFLFSEVWNKIGKTVSIHTSYDGSKDPTKQSSAEKARDLLMQIDPQLIEQFYELYKVDFMLMNYSNFTDPHFPLPLIS